MLLKPQFAVLPCGSVFLAGERNGKWREDKREGRVTRDNIEMAWAPVENPSRGQSGIWDCKPLVRFMEKNCICTKVK